MFGFDDAIMMAFAEEAATAEGAAAATEAATAAETASAANAAAAAATAAGTAEAVGALGAAGAGQGITQASMAADVLGGGAGAGSAGINAGQVGAQQAAASAIPNSGIMSPAQQAYLQASTASAGPGITSGTVPLSAPSAAPSVYDGLQTGTNFGAPVEPININPQASGYGNVLDNGGMNAPQPSALEQGAAKFGRLIDEYPKSAAAAAYLGAYHTGLLDPRNNLSGQGGYSGPLNAYKMSPNFQGRFANPQDYQPTLRRFQSGGIADITGGRMPVEQMSNAAAIGMNTGFPQADISGHAYSTPWQTPVSQNVVQGAADTGVNRMDDNMLATGGIVGYAKGGDTSKALDFYRQMYDPDRTESSAPGPARGPLAGGLGRDVGIYYDMDPDTRYQDALTATQIRNAKVAKRANMQMPTGKRPTPMGSLNLKPPGAQAEQAQSSLDPENAAQGGIMQAHGSTLGGYAAGGNPRLLKGPGDGMSDNIPATIAGKQPARLADGEFVIPADVVSHLGNGSTDAGAKKLHHMMDSVRKARTGRKAQGKQINPNKFMPK